MINILSLTISIFSFIVATFTALKQIKQTNESTNIAKQANDLTSSGNSLANYSANVQIKKLDPLQASTNHDGQFIPASSESDEYSITLKLQGYLSTKFGNISWIGALSPEYFPHYSFDAINMSPNQAKLKNSNNSFFETSFTITRNIVNNNLIRSRIYICVLDSNFNISINLIQIIVEPIIEFNHVDVTIMVKSENPRSGFKVANGFYRYFTEYDLLTYENTSSNRPWINSKNAETLNFDSQKEISSIFEDNEPVVLIKDEIREIRSHITDIIG